MERTEEDKLLRAPLMVVLGGQEYSIEPLVIRDARKWRKKLSKLLARLPFYANVTTDNPEGFATAVEAMLVDMPDEMADLFFAYAKDIDRESIEASATEAELAKALEEVIGLAFPLVRSLTGALGRLAR